MWRFPLTEADTVAKRLPWVAIEIFQDHWRKADILIAPAQVRKWHLALFRCDAEVRYRRMLDIE
jgi:hypothetical protein